MDAEIVERGRPGIVDVVANIGERTVHLPIGLRSPGDEARLLPEADDPVLGVFEDEDGMALAIEALYDAELVTLLLHAVTGRDAEPSLVRQLHTDEVSVTLAMEERLAFTVYSEVTSTPRPELEMLSALDEVGFNHVPAPIARWQRGGRDLGVVQEYLAGASVGWALALTSVRDFYDTGGPPEIAGGDFGAEARRLGTMTGRMHLALEEAFGRRPAHPATWAGSIETAVSALAPNLLDRPDVVELLAQLRTVRGPSLAIRTHGDFHLGRVYRTEQGWYVGDLGPGGRPSTSAGIVEAQDDGGVSGGSEAWYRSPVCDVADMLWSFGHVAQSAADEHDPTGMEGLVELARAWERRNRDCFIEGYLEVPGMGALVPADPKTLDMLSSGFGLERTARDL